MIEIIPAISIVGQKVARMHSGDLDNVVVYDERPLDMAIKFEEHGIQRIHLIDLQGAKLGRVKNVDVIELIKGYTDLKIDFGGGITDDDDVRIAFEHGAHAIHAASIAAKDPELFSSWIISYGRNKIILSADAIRGKISTRGWSKSTEIDLLHHIEYFHDQGVNFVKVTDIGCDEDSVGPPFELYKKVLSRFPDLKLLASGGVRSVDDIDKLQDIGVYGCIFAKAYYEGRILLKDLEKFIARQ